MKRSGDRDREKDRDRDRYSEIDIDRDRVVISAVYWQVLHFIAGTALYCW
jgi:hypothetical protein